MFQAIAYYIALPFIYLVSWMPFPMLYALSDFIYFLIYRVFGYRKKVVMKNLRLSFPEKKEAELRVIAKKFYRHLCDLLLESFKTLSISKKAMLARCKMTTDARILMDELAARNKSIVLVMGHQGNWEWGGNSFSLLCKQQLYVIYHPLQQPFFNKLIIDMRSRFGTKLIAMDDTFREMLRNRGELSATAFIADQSPSPENAHWTNFLHQDTPFFTGAERISSKLNFSVVYLFIRKIKRGHYQIEAEILNENPALLKEGTLTEGYVKRLEKDIISQPETWLWSHNRWKHIRKDT
jgi:KDO2-lipid IV(A) lauroyltransferase